MVELAHVHALGFLDQLVPHHDLFQKLFLGLNLISFEKLAPSNLVKTISLARELTQSLFDQFFKFWRITYALKDFPKILLHRATQSFEIRIGLNSLSEGWRLHLNHEKGCANAENVSLFPIVFGIHGEVPYLAIYSNIVENPVVVLRLHFALIFLQVDFIVPQLGCVIDLRAYIRPLVNHGVIILLEYPITINLLHPGRKTEISDDNSPLLVYK